MLVLKFSCDVCGAEKKETNHWWMAWAGTGGFYIAPLEPVEHTEQVKAVCGRTCATKLLERFMATGSLNV